MDYETQLATGVEPRRMRLAAIALLGGLASWSAAVGPPIARIPLTELVAGGASALLALAACRGLWRRLEGRLAVRVSATHVSHAGVRLAIAGLRVERSQWIQRGRVGMIATLRNGARVLSLGARGVGRDVEQSERRGRSFADACVRDVATLERLLASVGAPAPASDAPYRAKGGSDERVVSIVVAAPPIAWWRGIVDVEFGLALATQLALSHYRMITALGWFAVTLRKLQRTWRDDAAPLALRTLRSRARALSVETREGRHDAYTADATRAARLGRCDDLACLEIPMGGAAPARFAATSDMRGETEMYSPDYFVGPMDFEWLVRLTGARATSDDHEAADEARP